MKELFINYIVAQGWTLFWINAFITALGPLAIYYVNKPEQKTRRWGSVYGVASQPFWFALAWYTDSFGIFILCLFYSYSWCKGFYYNWIQVKNENKAELILKQLHELNDQELALIKQASHSELLGRGYYS